RLTVAEHGHRHYAPVAALSRDFSHIPECRVGFDVRGDDRRTSAGGSWMHRLVRGKSHREGGSSRVVAALASGGERRQMKLVADDSRERRAVTSQEAPRALHDRIEDGLWVRRRGADHSQNLRRGRLLGSRLSKLLIEIDDPSAVLGQPTGNRGLGFLGLGRLWTPAHRPPLASYESAGDRLGERARVSKWRGEPCGAAMSTDGGRTPAS